MSVLVMTLKQSDGEALVMLELEGMWSSPLLPLLPGPLWPGLVAPGRVRSIVQIWKTELSERTVYMYKKMDLALNNLQMVDMP